MNFDSDTNFPDFPSEPMKTFSNSDFSGDPVRRLTITSGSFRDTTRIYANNYMQAHFRVDFELNTGFEYIGMSLQSFDGSHLNAWRISTESNGFRHEIASQFRSDEIQQGEIQQGEIQQGEIQQGVAEHSVRLFSFNLYASTNRVGMERICVNVTARNIRTNEVVIYSTCNNWGIQRGSVTVDAIASRMFSVNDFFVEDGIVNTGSLVSRRYRFQPRDFRITMLNTNYPIDINHPGTRRLANTSFTNSFNGGNYLVDNSVLFIHHKVNEGVQTMMVTMWAIDRENDGSTRYRSFSIQRDIHTDNAINLWLIYGETIRNSQRRQSVTSLQDALPDSLNQIQFFDEYANFGIIHVKRSNDSDTPRHKGLPPGSVFRELGFSFM